MSKGVFKRLFSAFESTAVDQLSGPSRNSGSIVLLPDVLRTFTAFEKLAHDELVVLSNRLEVSKLPAGESLFSEGDIDDSDYFLLDGHLTLIANDGVMRDLVGGTEPARWVIASLRPRKYTAVAISDCSYVQVDHELLAQLIPPPRSQPPIIEESHVEEPHVEESPENDPSTAGIPYLHSEEEVLTQSAPAVGEGRSREAKKLMAAFCADLEAGKFVLTSLPEVAFRVRKRVDDADVTAQDIAEIISLDAAMAAKILKAANSTLFRTWEASETVTESVVRLGVKTTRQLVLSFALRDLFTSQEPALKRAMHQMWQHTVYHGAIAWTLANNCTGFSSEEAMSAAILSNIGALSVFNYLAAQPEVFNDPEKLAATLGQLKSDVGAKVLREWGFSDNLVDCATEVENWHREHTGETDLCDICVVASYHAYRGQRELPPAKEVPAFKRVNSIIIDRTIAGNFLEAARDQIDHARALLNV